MLSVHQITAAATNSITTILYNACTSCCNRASVATGEYAQSRRACPHACSQQSDACSHSLPFLIRDGCLCEESGHTYVRRQPRPCNTPSTPQRHPQPVTCQNQRQCTRCTPATTAAWAAVVAWHPLARACCAAAAPACAAAPASASAAAPASA